MAERSRIVWVAEAGGSQGYGHLHRLKTLANHLKDDFGVYFFILQSWPLVIQHELLQAFGGEVFENYDGLTGIVKEGDIVVWDGYGFDKELMISCKAQGAMQVFWDDFLHPKPLADLLINAAPGVRPSQLSGAFHTRNLAGHKWFPLQDAFRITYDVQRVPHSLLICFGGSDPLDYTAQLLFQASSTVSWSKIIVVTGQGYKGAHSLRPQIDGLSHAHKVEWYQAVDTSKMAQLMQACEFALVPSSSVAYEALYSGCKVLTGTMVANQDLFHNGFVQKDWVIDAGQFKEKETEKALLSKNRSVVPFPKEELADKKEWVKVFRSLALIPAITVRKADEKDLSITFRWASHPQVRKYAFDSRGIPFEEHQSWYVAAIKDVAKVYLILSYQGKDLGSCRFDIRGAAAKISYLLDPDFQGQGFGLPLLQASLQFLEANRPDIEEINGEVMEENKASVKIFETLGFAKERKGNTWVFRKGKSNFKP